MTLEDLEREIIKVTQQGGMARVPETTMLEAMECDEEQQRDEMDLWLPEFCKEHLLTPGQDKDMFGQVEHLFHHV